jgi:para-aminobenzoate synthetase/4-amino-4-deoxychorismate lyase
VICIALRPHDGLAKLRPFPQKYSRYSCTMICADGPFVLLDDARVNGAAPSRLYTKPVKTLIARDAKELMSVLNELQAAQGQGLHAAGYFAYEAGLAVEAKLSATLEGRALPTPLAWFGLFADFTEIDAMTVPYLLPDPAGAWLGQLRPKVARHDYDEAFAVVQRYITNGDIYQANLTLRAEAKYAGHPLALYAAIRPRAAAGYGGLIWTGEQWFLSFSPELFFALKDGRVTTKPMKGTAARVADPVADAAVAAEMHADPKQRAENLMIVDLLRNDLSRVAAAGSVEVPELFTVESYPTVHTMTSTVTALLPGGVGAVALIRAIFPCGSITGAPKIRAMEIIDEIESTPRGIYCGSIGRIDASGDAAFNVAIRTLHLNTTEKLVSIGLGSGVVADSNGAAEWAECLAKGRFAAVTRPDFDLIETMRFEPATGIKRLEFHLDRMKESGRALQFYFDRHDARNRLHAATFHLDSPMKIRLLAARSGALAIEVQPLAPTPSEPLAVKLVPLPVEPGDFRLQHKTTDRAFYDDARKAAGAQEVIFVDREGHLTEGSVSALFVERDGKLLTPPLRNGLLPSVLRRELIETGRAHEAELTEADLHGEFFLGNSVRELIRAKRVA